MTLNHLSRAVSRLVPVQNKKQTIKKLITTEENYAHARNVIKLWKECLIRDLGAAHNKLFPKMQFSLSCDVTGVNPKHMIIFESAMAQMIPYRMNWL